MKTPPFFFLAAGIITWASQMDLHEAAVGNIGMNPGFSGLTHKTNDLHSYSNFVYFIYSVTCFLHYSWSTGRYQRCLNI